MKFPIGILAVISAVTARPMAKRDSGGCGAISNFKSVNVINKDSSERWTLSGDPQDLQNLKFNPADNVVNGDQVFQPTLTGSQDDSVFTFATANGSAGVFLDNNSHKFVKSSTPTKFKISCDNCGASGGSPSDGCTMAVVDDNGSPNGTCVAFQHFAIGGDLAGAAPCNGSESDSNLKFTISPA